jgi:hypothetical protein
MLSAGCPDTHSRVFLAQLQLQAVIGQPGLSIDVGCGSTYNA